MAPPSIITSPATEEDASLLASVMTAAFAASDAAYPLIWGAGGDSIHHAVALEGLFTPVQKENRSTYKAMDGDRLVGFATWDLPRPEGPKKQDGKGEEAPISSGLPEIPGVNMALWGEMVYGLKEAQARDFKPWEDMCTLALFFVHPEYQRKGVGSLLLELGLKEADELNARVWLSSTAKAVSVYEKKGWKVVQRYDVDLGKYGGEGVYSRAWMLRERIHTP